MSATESSRSATRRASTSQQQSAPARPQRREGQKMAEPLLEISGLNKSFGPVHVLHDVDLTINAGEVVALVGDNGAGKSTLVKCIAGLHSIERGTVLFDGQPVTLPDPRVASALGIEFVYQDLALADNLD